MKKVMPKKDIFIKQTLKKEDYLELPMDDSFYEKMHDQIMLAVEATEIKTQPKWSKARVFLENKSESYRSGSKKLSKLLVVSMLSSMAVGFIGLSRHIIVEKALTRFL